MPLVHIRLKCPKPKDYTDEPVTFGEHIKKRRRELGLTQKQAADAMHVNQYTIIKWERAPVWFEPPVRTVPAVLAFLQYDPFPAPTTLGQRLLHARRKNGWSEERAAYQLGVDRTTYQRWERGGLILYRKHQAAVAQLLGLDAAALGREMRVRWNGKHRRWESCLRPTGTDVVQAAGMAA